MVFIVSDHGGFAAKQKLVEWLKTQGISVQDLGPARLKPTDDYPVWASRLARAVKRHPGSQGIALCRSGIGMAIAANKFSGIRAAQVFSPAMAQASRRDEDANVLSMAADYHSLPELQRIISAWLKTPFRPTKRFSRRLRELKRLEYGS